MSAATVEHRLLEIIGGQNISDNRIFDRDKNEKLEGSTSEYNSRNCTDYCESCHCTATNVPRKLTRFSISSISIVAREHLSRLHCRDSLSNSSVFEYSSDVIRILRALLECRDTFHLKFYIRANSSQFQL